MIPEITSDKELFVFIKGIEIKESISLKEMFSKYSFNSINIDELLEKLKAPHSVILIDARSENEFNESSLPFSINFPVLNNLERHNVGLLYKKYSQNAAVWLAQEYANPKSDSLKQFLQKNKTDTKEIIVFCWRGGGRSKYLSKMINDLDYDVKFLLGGQKSYRKKVFEFFNDSERKFNFLELRGLTGSGKTEILSFLKKDLPVIDLEFAARHYSSLFGNVPYDIKDYKRVKNQSAFENYLFEQFIKYDLNNLPLFLIESESKRVGDFSIPDNIYTSIEISPCIEIQSSFQKRIERIVKDYFGEDRRGIESMKNIFIEKESFFKSQLSKEGYVRLLDYLENGEVTKFTSEMMSSYYDKRYKVKPKQPISFVNSDNCEEAKNKILEIYKSL